MDKFKTLYESIILELSHYLIEDKKETTSKFEPELQNIFDMTSHDQVAKLMLDITGKLTNKKDKINITNTINSIVASDMPDKNKLEKLQIYASNLVFKMKGMGVIKDY